MARATSGTATNGPEPNRPTTGRPAVSRTTTSRTAINEGDRQLRRTAARFGEEFRLIRLRTGVSQAAVARAIGVDRASVCRIEGGDPTVSDRTRARAAAVLGADFRLGIYPDSAPLIHDAAHARVVEALVRLRHPSWRAKVEAPVPGTGRRSTDLRLDRGDETVLFEVETHVHALEAIIREGEDKRSAVGADAVAADAVAGEEARGRRVHVVLVLPPTQHHRALVAAHPGTINAAFPASTTDIRRALTSAGGPWPGDGILWLGAGVREIRVPAAVTLVADPATNRRHDG
jgi:transcriptional regulator with XRE-family HTH domain